MVPAAEAAAGADSPLPGCVATRAAAAPQGEVGTSFLFRILPCGVTATSLCQTTAAPPDRGRCAEFPLNCNPPSRQFPPKPQATSGFPRQHPGQKGSLKPPASFILASGLLREMGLLLLGGGSSAGEGGLCSATPRVLTQAPSGSPAVSGLREMLSPRCPAGRCQPEISHACPRPPLGCPGTPAQGALASPRWGHGRC